ncbi:MAG: EFR1 family ferrodoxin [Clostridiaceae bacterium]
MDTEIYYFSGTGNSMFIAKEVQKRIPNSEILPIACLLKKDIITSNGKTIGIVFPVHALTIPLVVMKFLRRIDLSEAEYIFAIADRYGTVFHGFKKIDRILRKKRKRLNSQFVIDMCSNDSRHGIYNTPSGEEIASYERRVLKKLDAAAGIILGRGSHYEDIKDHRFKSASNPVSAFLIERLVLALMNIAEHTRGVNYFYHDDKCTGCGICEKVCLSGKISMADGNPVWEKNTFCYMCFACLNFCPVKAVQIHDIPGVKSHTKENGRYPHPYASIGDMLRQKGE